MKPEKVEPVIEPNKPNYVYVNTAEEDSMVVQFILAWRRGKRELIPDPPPKPVEEIKKEEPESTADETKEGENVDGETKDGESEVKTETQTEGSEETKAESEEKEPSGDETEKKSEETTADGEPSAEDAEKKSETEDGTEKIEAEKPSEEAQPMETETVESKAETATEEKMEVDEEKESTEKPAEEETAKPEGEEVAKDDTAVATAATDDKEVAEKDEATAEEQPMETDSAESKDEAKTDEVKSDEDKSEEKSEETVAAEEKKEETTEVKAEAEEEKKPEPVYIEVDEYYVKYRNFSYLHCEWRTEEELLKGDRRVSAKIRRFEMKRAQQFNIFDNLEDEPFNPDFVETDRVLDMSEHEDPVTGKKTKNFLVKWKSLPYEDCTWELEDDVEEKKIEEYYRFTKVPPKDKWKPKRRPTPDQWRKLEESPVYKNNNTLRPYQLEGLNWLKFSWYNSHNCILADEMGLGKTVS